VYSDIETGCALCYGNPVKLEPETGFRGGLHGFRPVQSYRLYYQSSLLFYDIPNVLRTAELIRSTELPSASAGSGTKKTAYDPKEESGGMIESSGMIESGGSVGTATGAACGQKPDPDADLLHDLDYAVLGTSEKLFLSYEQTIRLEYAHLSDEAYAAGRSSFLRTLLQKDVFRTEYFKVRYEEQALHNISMQLERFGKYSGGG